MSPAATLGYAFTLGLVAALNPCGFPLLPAYLALFAGDREQRAGWVSRTSRGLLAGLCMTGGFVIVFGLIGAAASGTLQLLTGWTGWVMILLGGAMIALGVRGLAVGNLSIPVPRIRFASGRTALAMGGFGAAYAIASLSCALPLFLAAVTGSANRGLLEGTAGFLAYAAGMGLFVTAASLIAAHLGAETVRRLRPATRLVPRLASGVVILVGGYQIGYWVLQLLDPLAISPVTKTIDAAGATVTGWISQGALPIGGSLGVLLLGAAIWVAWKKHPTPLTRKEHPDGTPTHTGT